MEENNQQINPQLNQQPLEGQATVQETPNPELVAKKNLSRKRIFYAILGIDIALIAFLLFEIISLFF